MVTSVSASLPFRSVTQLDASGGSFKLVGQGVLNPELQSALEESFQELDNETANEIPLDQTVPQDITDILRDLDKISRHVGFDNVSNLVSLDPQLETSSPFGSQFEGQLAKLVSAVQADTAGKGDDVKGAVLAYVAHALTVIDNRFQTNQENVSISLSQNGGIQPILPNGKGQGTDFIDETQTQRDHISEILGGLLSSQGLNDSATQNLINKFSEAAHTASLASNNSKSSDSAFQQSLDSLSDLLASARKQDNSPLRSSFLIHLVNDFGGGLDNSFSQQLNEVKRDLTINTDPNTIDYLKNLGVKLSSQKDAAAQSIANLLQELVSPKANSSFSSITKTGLLYNATA